MASSGTIHVRVGCKWIAILVFTCFLSLLTPTPARAEDGCGADDDSVIDGLVHPVPPSYIRIDGKCIVFDKTVADLTSGVNPAKTAAPGDNLRYTLRFRVRLPKTDDVRNPLIAHAVIGCSEQLGCSKEHTR